MIDDSIRCSSCGRVLNDPYADTPGTPCCYCGCAMKTISVHVSESLTPRNGLGMTLKRQGRGGWVVKSKSGLELHRTAGRMAYKEQVFDREQDHYLEVVVNLDSGIVIHECDEPLSQHQGHGSAQAPFWME